MLVRHNLHSLQATWRDVRRSTSGALMQLALVAVAFVAYMVVRATTVGGETVAVQHAHDVMQWEGNLGLDLELGAQRVLAAPGLARAFFNAVYVWAYWPTVVGALVMMWHYDRHRYRMLRDALFLSGAVGLVFFAAFPLAPPRMLDGFIDTVSVTSRQHLVAHPSGVVNAYAAFPSFHIGWFSLALAVLVWHRDAVLRLCAALLASTMALAVVVTANHYVVDVVGGIVICAGALAAARRIEHHRAADDATGRDQYSSVPRPSSTSRRNAS